MTTDELKKRQTQRKRLRTIKFGKGWERKYCCICDKDFTGEIERFTRPEKIKRLGKEQCVKWSASWGHNPDPLFIHSYKDRCCDSCNENFVKPARIGRKLQIDLDPLNPDFLREIGVYPSWNQDTESFYEEYWEVDRKRQEEQNEEK